MISGLDHVQVACPAGSEDRLRDFYAGVLGMSEVAKPAALVTRGGVWFRSGGCELHCGVEAEFRPAGQAHPGIAVTDARALADLAERCVAAGHPVSWSDDIPGVRRFHVLDPVGNRLELLARDAPTSGGWARGWW